MIKCKFLGAAISAFVAVSVSVNAQNVCSDSWAVTDALGRTAVQDADSAKLRDGKEIAMFYWTWHERNYRNDSSVRNISAILRQNPEAMLSYDHPAWGKKRHWYYWEEPLLGYYQTFDPWVLRKHAEMLADAKVDAVFFDCTNGTFTWDKSYKALLKVWSQACADGVKSPKIAFMLPFAPLPNSLVSLKHLYRELYKPGLYKDLWYCLDGKPMIMAYSDNLNPDDPEEKEILDFFTFRPGQPDYVNGPSQKEGRTQWGWLEVYPQNGYGASSKGFEQVTVGIAQNTSAANGGHCSAFNVDDSFGRSYSARRGFDKRPDAYLYGWNFEEQWSRAFELDPKVVFVTGWNEYIADMFDTKGDWHGNNYSFVDQYDWDHSRDIEPNKGWGNKGDVYYYMLVDKARRFKGIKPAEAVSAPRTIKIDRVDDWKGVTPVYTDYQGDVVHRCAPGAFNLYYTNATGRNDIVEAQVARDKRNVYFHVRTKDALTPRTDNNWMVLYIDIDRSKATGWEGYDFVVNRGVSCDDKATLEKCVGNGWQWKAAGNAQIAVFENEIVLGIPRSALGMKDKKLNFEFKWSDNMQQEGNPMDFYLNGDVAPSARFNYVYCE